MRIAQERKDWARRMEKNAKSPLSGLFVRLYAIRKLRKLVLRVCLKLEGGVFFSRTLKIILKRYHDVTVGNYSYGPCNIPDYLPRGTIIGAYCSVANEVLIRRRNHPVSTLTQHPFFYNKIRGIVGKDTINLDEENPLTIGNDVWIGDRAIILPNCKHIGNGAIIGAGSIVTRDVAPYTIVAGSPARVVKERYSAEIQRALEKTAWWELSLPELLSAEGLLFDPVSIPALEMFAAALSGRKPETGSSKENGVTEG